MKKLSYLIVLSMLLVMSMGGIASANHHTPTTRENYYQQLITDAYRQFNQLDNYRMVMRISADGMKDGKSFALASTGLFDIQAQPLKLNGLMRIKLQSDETYKEEQVNIYALTTTEQLAIYFKDSNKWQKNTIIPYIEALDIVNRLHSPEAYLTAIKAITLVSQDESSLQLMVTIDPAALFYDLNKVGDPKEKARLMMIVLTANAGLLDYQITIDKQTGLIKHFEADMTAYAKRVAEKMLAASAKPSQKDTDLLEQVFTNMAIMIEADFSRFNQVDVTTPDDLGHAS